jgi:hypothetical protein
VFEERLPVGLESKAQPGTGSGLAQRKHHHFQSVLSIFSPHISLFFHVCISSITILSIMSNNNNNTWGVSGTYADNASGSTATENSSETEILWGNIFFSLLLIVGFTLLIILIVSIEQSSRQQDQGGVIGSRVNVEEQGQTKNSADTQKSHGRRWILLVPVFAIVVAMSLSIVANTSCDFVKLVVWSSSTPIDPMLIGIWSVVIPNTSDRSYFSKGTCYGQGRDSELLDELYYHEEKEAILP